VDDDDLIRALLPRLAAAAARQRAAEAAVLGVLPTDLLALHHLSTPEGLTPAELSRTMSLSPGGTAAVIERLERERLVDRHPGPSGRRRILVHPTAKATAALGALRAPFERDVKALTDRLDAADRIAAERLLAQLTDLQERHADALADRAEQAAARAAGVPTPVLWS